MGVINLFKILEDKQDDFVESMTSGGLDAYDRTINFCEQELVCNLTVFTSPELVYPKWNWILDTFDVEEIKNKKQSWAVFWVIFSGDMYAITFGNAFYHVDKYCDKDFAFNFGRRLVYKKIKTTTQTNPNSNKNKVVYSYQDITHFEYESGESFAKVKGKIKLDDDFTLFKEDVEIGTSIKFSVEQLSISICLELINYVKELLEEGEIKTKIPMFNKIKDNDLIQQLEDNLLTSLRVQTLQIRFSDFEVIGTTEIFYSTFSCYELRYGYKSMNIEILSEENIRAFCSKFDFDYNEIALNISVKATDESGNYEKFLIRDLIDHIDEENNAILLSGEWYQFNDDYLSALRESLSEIEIVCSDQFNWSDELKLNLQETKYLSEKNNPEYAGLDEVKIKEKIRNKYYAERLYNERMQEFGYICDDRILTITADGKIEKYDLYKDETIFAVKIGNSSGKLCYAIDQISSAAKLIKKRNVTFERALKKVGLWLVLDRQPLPLTNGVPNINELDMLVLKIKIDVWKREMWNLGFNPVIYIGYKT